MDDRCDEAARGLIAEAMGLDPDVREAFLRGACRADPVLRAAIDRLIAGPDSPGGPTTSEAPRPARPDCGAALGVGEAGGPARSAPCGSRGRDAEADGGQGEEGDITPQMVGPSAIRTAGRFELLSVLGSGGYGIVYKARDPRLDRVVAVKILHGGGGLASADERERFLREARNAAQLRHPSIVAVHEVGEHGGAPFLVSDYVAGVTLADWLTGRSPTFRESAELLARLADALDFAHQHGVIHRDVKPTNVMIAADNRVFLMDFGLALRAGVEASLTADGAILGTPAYMSPEQARGESRRVDGRSDVYSLGVVLYRLLAGEMPFRGRPAMLIHQVLHDAPRPPRSRNDRIPLDLETICLKAMAKEPARRYATAAALADDLRLWLAGMPIRARPAGPARRAWSWCRRRPALAGLTAAVVVVAAAGAAGVASSLVFALRGWDTARRQEGLALRRLDQMIAAYGGNLARIIDDPRLRQPEARAATLALLEQPRALLAELARELTATPAADPADRARLRQALTQVAAIDAAIAPAEVALGDYDRLLDFERGCLRGDADDPEARLGLAVASNRLGNLLADAGRPSDAGAAYDEARAAFAELARRRPGAPEVREGLAATANNLARLRLADDPEAAYAAYAEAIAEYERLVADDPGSARHRSRLATAGANLGITLRNAQQFDRAVPLLLRAATGFEALARDDPADLDAADGLARVLADLALAYRGPERIDEAIATLRRAVAVGEANVAAHPDAPSCRATLARAENGLANALRRRAGRESEAIDPFLRGAFRFARLVQEAPGDRGHRDALEAMVGSAFGLLRELGRPDATEADHLRLLGFFEAAAETHPEDAGLRFLLARSRYNMACLLARQFGRDPADESRARRAVEFLAAARAASPRVGERPTVLGDPDLEAIRGRDDFRAFVAGLPAAPAAPGG